MAAEVSSTNFYGSAVERPLAPGGEVFAASVEASREHVATCGGSAPCGHAFVCGWQLGVCSECGASVSDARRAAEEAAEAAALLEDRCSFAAGSSHGERLRGWGVRVEWLLAFTWEHGCWDWPTWRVVRDIIKVLLKEERSGAL